LSGEIRPVPRLEQDIQECARLCFEEVYVATYNKGVSANQVHLVVTGQFSFLFEKRIHIALFKMKRNAEKYLN